MTPQKKNIPWNKGIKMSKEFCAKVSLAHKNRGTVPPNRKGINHSEETKKKMSNSQTGKHHTPLTIDSRIKMSIAKKGCIPWNKGKRNCYSRESLKRMSEAQKGEKSYLWRGGVSREPYGKEWTKTLKRSIRERDNYVCQLCSNLQGDISFVIHHIDYNKKNNSPLNLITLCRNCHNKTNFNRKYWVEYFKKVIWEGTVQELEAKVNKG